VLVVTIDTMTTGNLLEQAHPDDEVRFVAVLPRPGAPVQTFLDVIERQPGWRLLTQPPYGTVLEIEVPV
jgi:hypothetical protein